MRPSFVALAALLACAPPAAGQPSSSPADTLARAPRWQLGFAADVGQPVGPFRRNVKNAVGGDAHVLLRLDRKGRASLRLQAGWLNYGSESQQSCLGTAPHCRVALDLTTANGIFTLALGPQFAVPVGPLRAYGYGLVGMSRFATLSGVNGGLVPDIVAADENFGDGGVVWRGGVGLQLPVRRNTSIDIGIGYEIHGTRNYLTEGGLTDRPDGTLGFDVKRSKADLFAMRIGVTTAFRQKRCHADRAP